MRRICYQVAMSLDGYIAGPNGEFDWIVKDPDIDFVTLFAQFDTHPRRHSDCQLKGMASERETKRASSMPGQKRDRGVDPGLAVPKGELSVASSDLD
jgi:hypothetical protein